MLIALALQLAATALLPHSARADAPKIVFLGDSLTAGYGLDPADAYPALIEKKLADEKLAWKVVNAGLSGDTTAGGSRRLGWVLRQKPSVLVVALGGNDMLRGIPPEQTEKNLDSILRQAKEAGARPVLLGMRAMTNLGADYRKAFDSLYARLARKHSVELLPFYIEDVAMKAELNQADGIHPTAEGQKKIAARVGAFLVPLLRKWGKSP